jgi:hypothetical protein
VQVPVVAGSLSGRAATFALWTPEASVVLPRRAHPLAARLSTMPRLSVDPQPASGASKGRAARSATPGSRFTRDVFAIQVLRDAGILAEEDLPLLVVPADPSALEGWRFA